MSKSVNKKVWLQNYWFKNWNANKTAFSIKSPFNTNALIWINKNYYLSSNFDGWFGIEFNILNYKTKQIHYYYEITYSLKEKQIKYISGEILSEYFEKLNESKSEEYRKLVFELNGEKILE